ncbi:MAG: M3 family metallopeptidase, partial [Pseudomonadota bacterium]
MISRRMTMGGSLFAFAALTVSCSDLPSTEQEEQKQIEETTSQPPMMKLTEASENNMKNIITENYQGPFGGVPQFDKVALEDFEPGVKAAIAEGLAEIDAIAENEAPATFENTIVALERQGKALSRASTYYYLWSNNLSSPEFQEIESKIDPLYAEYRSQIIQNEKLFKRIETVWNDKDALNELGEEEQRLTWDYYTDYVRAGAALSTETKERIGDINEDLSKLYTQFSQNLLHDEESYVTWLKEEQLSGLPENLKEAAASAATERGRSGEYAILNTRSSMEPFLTYADDRALREQVWRTYYNRGDNGDETDNNAIISDILRLRNERSRLQGYDNFAARAIEKQVAKTPAQAMDLMQRVWPAAIARVEEEVADMQAVADREGANITIAPWDYRYYAEKVRQETYDLDTNEVKQYLQLSHLVDGMFWMAKELYDFNFQDVTDQVPVFHEDVRVWEVTREGDHQGLFYFDPYARPGKRSGAWMTSYRTQDKLDGATPVIVSNNSNFIKGAEGEPTLISWDDATTLLHEFGHAVHGLLSDVTYPSLSGTAVPRDYVEFPSQVHENWLMTSE